MNIPAVCLLFLSSALIASTMASCDSPPLSAGCLCNAAAAGQCANNLTCAGVTSKTYGQGTCGGDVNTITCPRSTQEGFIDFWVQNTTADYCANTQIRTCNDENGCVGVKYSNDTDVYQRCIPEYGNPTTGHYSSSGIYLPAKVRIAADTTYVTFVCDPDPGVKVPIVTEFWPVTAGTWPKSMPPMGKSDCSFCSGSGICPWETDGPGAECNCCTGCTPDNGGYPPQFNINISNPTQHPWKVLLQLFDPAGGYNGKSSTCVLRHELDCGDYCTSAIVEEYQRSVDPESATQIPPGAVDFMMGVPPNVASMTFVPLYTSTLSTCIVENLSGGEAPRALLLTDTGGGQDCQITRGSI